MASLNRQNEFRWISFEHIAQSDLRQRRFELVPTHLAPVLPVSAIQIAHDLVLPTRPWHEGQGQSEDPESVTRLAAASVPQPNLDRGESWAGGSRAIRNSVS